jgi:predicted phage terminase large subunit-like protein
MNDPVDQDSVEFKKTWFGVTTEHHKAQYTKAKTVLSLDPAFRLKQYNDYNGLVLTKVLPNNDVCILYAEQLKLNPDRLVYEIFRLYERYRFDLLVVETAQAQILLVSLLRDEMKRRNVYFVIDEINPGTTDSKAARIRGLIPHYANGRIYHAPGLQDLENQLTEFPRNSHDDIIDALAYQIPHWTAPGADAKPKPVIQEGSWDWWKRSTANRGQPRLRSLFSDFRRGR